MRYSVHSIRNKKLVNVFETNNYQEAEKKLFEEQPTCSQFNDRAIVLDNYELVIVADGVVGNFDAAYLPQMKGN